MNISIKRTALVAILLGSSLSSGCALLPMLGMAGSLFKLDGGAENEMFMSGQETAKSNLPYTAISNSVKNDGAYLYGAYGDTNSVNR